MDRPGPRRAPGWWKAAGCVFACTLTIGGLTACGSSDNRLAAPTATVTALPTSAPTATKTVSAVPSPSATQNAPATSTRSYGSNSTIFDCAVQEVDPQGNLLWDWRASNHTDPAKESAVPQGAGTDASPADVYHCNSIDVNANGDVLVSFRHMNSVLLVSKNTGNVVWKLSGTPYNKDGAQILTIEGDPEVGFYMQHDARFQPNGNISLFDDHSAAAGVPGPARGVEYALDLDAGTAQVVWQYQGTGSSSALGSVRRFVDGTNLIGWGNYNGTANLAFTEVDAAGRDMLDMSFATRGNWSYRAEKVPVGTFDIDVLRGSAGLP